MSSSCSAQLSSPHPALQAALAAHGWRTATAIQAQALAPIRAGRDVIALAPTGSGKTLTFVLPLLERYVLAGARNGAVASLVLVPTRELAHQVAEALQLLSARLPQRPKVVVAIGGVSINPQMMALRGGADVLIATPGRALDLLAHNALKLDQVRQLVLDEADRLLDAGFADEVGQLLARLPVQRQTLLFSATFDPALDALAGRYLANSERIDVRPLGATAPAPAVVQRAIEVDAEQRTRLLTTLIAQARWPRALVFVASRRSADNVAAKLVKAGISAHSMHGEHSNGTRMRVLREFEGGMLQVMVATDVAARGLDMAQLPVVINYDLPRSTEDYTHRIGRTGRAGHAGEAISFVDASSEGHLRLIEKRQGQRMPREQVTGFERQTPAPDVAPRADNGGIKGKHPSRKDKLRAAAGSHTPAG